VQSLSDELQTFVRSNERNADVSDPFRAVEFTWAYKHSAASGECSSEPPLRPLVLKRLALEAVRGSLYPKVEPARGKRSVDPESAEDLSETLESPLIAVALGKDMLIIFEGDCARKLDGTWHHEAGVAADLDQIVDKFLIARVEPDAKSSAIGSFRDRVDRDHAIEPVLQNGTSRSIPSEFAVTLI